MRSRCLESEFRPVSRMEVMSPSLVEGPRLEKLRKDRSNKERRGATQN
jgi:hypothetical protein